MGLADAQDRCVAPPAPYNSRELLWTRTTDKWLWRTCA